MLTINYNKERDIKGNTYFKQYPDGWNIAALWKEFWNLRIENDENIKTITFRLFNNENPEKTDSIFANAPLYFPKWNVQWKGWMPRSIIITPKENVLFLDNYDWLVDKTISKIISQKEYEAIRSSTWFIS